jgi:hypothetical protein
LTSSPATIFQSARFPDARLFVGGNVHLVTEFIPSLLLHNDEGQHENVRIESAGWVDAKTRFRLAFEYAPGDM